MKKFIEVTDIGYTRNRRLCLNVETIACFRMNDNEAEGTVLHVVGDDHGLHLKESYDEIYKMLELD